MQNPKNYLSIFLILLVPTFIPAQSAEDYDKDFKWEKASETKTIMISVKPNADKLEMEFEGEITEGEFNLVIYDTEGNKVTGFNLSTKMSSGANVVVESGENTSTISVSKSSTVTNINTNTNTDSDSGSSISISTSESGDNTISISSSGKNKNKNKNKNKDKNKDKNKTKNKDKDSKGYTVTSTSSDSKKAKGVMKKTIIDPVPGEWKFVLELKDVTGTLSAEIDQD